MYVCVRGGLISRRDGWVGVSTGTIYEPLRDTSGGTQKILPFFRINDLFFGHYMVNHQIIGQITHARGEIFTIVPRQQCGMKIYGSRANDHIRTPPRPPYGCVVLASELL